MQILSLDLPHFIRIISYDVISRLASLRSGLRFIDGYVGKFSSHARHHRVQFFVGYVILALSALSEVVCYLWLVAFEHILLSRFCSLFIYGTSVVLVSSTLVNILFLSFTTLRTSFPFLFYGTVSETSPTEDTFSCLSFLPCNAIKDTNREHFCPSSVSASVCPFKARISI